MNSFFCSIGKDLASNIVGGYNPLLLCDYFQNINVAKSIFKSIQVQQIREAIGKLKTSQSFGDDGISSYLLKLAMPFIEDSLVYLFNTSLETSQFPDPWKIARVSPIFKDGDKTEKSNYRPISELPVVSRLFEKLVFNQLYQYWNGNCFINSNQSGFRELYSTATCLLKNTDDWYNGMDTGNLVGMVFIDLKKAFDTVGHQILCRKLGSDGVLHRELAWFGSYLSNRAQYCRVNGVDSKIENIEVGAPQGSCLGPLLFLVYINDLPRALKNSTTSMYARLQKLQNRAARIVTNSCFDTPSNQLIETLRWKTINELIDTESKTMVFKSLNELAHPYLRSLFRNNLQSTSYRLRNTSTDLRLPKKHRKWEEILFT